MRTIIQIFHLLCCVSLIHAQSSAVYINRINQIIRNDYYKVLYDVPPSVSLIGSDTVRIQNELSTMRVFSIHDVVAITLSKISTNPNCMFYSDSLTFKNMANGQTRFYMREFIALTHDDSVWVLVDAFGSLFKSLGINKPPKTCAWCKSDSLNNIYAYDVIRKNDDPSKEIYGINQKITGTFTVLYPNGKIRKEVNFANGICHGVQKRYREDGSLQYEDHYKNGIQHGTFTTYNKKGEITQQYEYDNGVLKE